MHPTSWQYPWINYLGLVCALSTSPFTFWLLVPVLVKLTVRELPDSYRLASFINLRVIYHPNDAKISPLSWSHTSSKNYKEQPIQGIPELSTVYPFDKFRFHIIWTSFWSSYRHVSSMPFRFPFDLPVLFYNDYFS